MCFSAPKIELPPPPPPPAPVPGATISKVRTAITTRAKPKLKGFSPMTIPVQAPTVGGVPAQVRTTPTTRTM